jgi:two-component system, LytTR family, response regulator
MTRALIVDDEPLARQKLRGLIEDAGWIDDVQEAASLASARLSLRAAPPDVLFLDIRLPDGDGFALLGSVGPGTRVVFTTAFDQYAVTAFEMQALDYLVKPFSAARFANTLRRIRADGGDTAPSRERIGVALAGHVPDSIYVRTGSELRRLDLAHVERIEGADDHAALWCHGRRFLFYRRLSDLEALLGPAGFVRVHRSHLVNMSHVSRLITGPDGRVQVVLRSGSQVVVSRGRAAELRDRLGVHRPPSAGR